MYNHREERVDVVDLDPYGTAAPFIDSAVQCITDGGWPHSYFYKTISSHRDVPRSALCNVYRSFSSGDN
jgi:hypothetical protein